MAILFQGNSGPQGGVSGCDTYAYGFTSSCVDPNTGLNRGFTQEWYYDDNVDAWIAIGEAVTGGVDLDNVGNTYTSSPHTPVSNTFTSGNIRKLAFLDPDTGGLTFDYVHYYDIIDPSEKSFSIQTTRWYTARNNVFDSGPEYGGSVDGESGFGAGNGVTLCSDGNYNYIFSSGSVTSPTTSGLRIVFNGTVSSPFHQDPLGNYIIVDIDDGNSEGNEIFPNTVGAADGSLGATLPVELGATSGTNDYAENSFFAGFTIAGPSHRAYNIEFTYVDPIDGVTKESLMRSESNRVATENVWYAFVTDLADDPNGLTAGQIISEAKGASGSIRILKPNTTDADHVFNVTIPRSELGNATSGRLMLAFPKRCNVVGEDDIFFAPNLPSAAGFGTDGNRYNSGITLTNDFNYSELYEVFAAGPIGVDPAGVKVNNQ